jgi:hypothetical protein
LYNRLYNSTIDYIEEMEKFSPRPIMLDYF